MRARLFVFTAVLLPTAVLSQAYDKKDEKPMTPAWSLPAAPYVPPTVGTRYTFTKTSQEVTKVDGMKTYFTDNRGRMGMFNALFIPDSPDQPLIIADSSLRRLWPLRAGNITDLVTRRGEVRNLWRITVVGAESISVAAGRFATYRIDGVEQTILTPNPKEAVVNIVTWWYAPSIAAVVKFNTLQAVGSRQGAMQKNELVLFEKPGMKVSK